MTKKLAILFSGGKDSVYAAYLAQKQGYNLSCLISIHSENKESYMFHTPSIEKTKQQAEAMQIPLIIQNTKGEKEIELEDMKSAIKKAIKEFKIKGIITGAIESIYQATRVQKICNELEIECFNPLWQKNEKQYLNELIDNKFEVILVGVYAYPLDETYLGTTINKEFLKKINKIDKKFAIHPAGEGGEFETLVIDCPLFRKRLNITKSEKNWEENSGNLIIEEIKLEEKIISKKQQ